MNRSKTTGILFTGIFCLLVATLGQAKEAAPDPAEKQKKKKVEPATSFVTQHSGVFNGKKLDYTVTAGETYLKDAKGEPKASIFTFAYVKQNVADNKTRPVTFVWNGGPGSASLWLHMGTFGAKRVSLPSNADHPGASPYAIVDATETILDVTDLVFVDPVGTGFSKALGEHKDKEFWGLNEDARSMAEFIRDWTNDNGRWNSPKFLLGESFGTTRAASVAKYMQNEFMLSLNGIIFISQALDYAGSSPYMRNNIISHITYLPTMAAAALYHGKVDPPPVSLEAFMQQARVFATDELLPALFKGNTLDQASRDHIRDRLAWFTGLSAEFIERADLRVNGHRFAKELLRDQGLSIGLLDARYTRDDIDDVASNIETDASSIAISSAFNTALRDYMQSDLNIDWDRNYIPSGSSELSAAWNWSTAAKGKGWEPSFVNTARELSSVLRNNPSLRVLVSSGYHDLVTPFFDAEYTLNRHDIQAGRIEYKYYEGGHMMYVTEPSRTQLLDDVRNFINSQLEQ